MAGSGFLALLDDIVTILDDVALAAKRTAAVAGDDVAVNAEQMIGIDPRRELPIIGAVAKGSLVNKAFLIPGALGISVAAPWAITPLLMIGGAYLCYEGTEKVLHSMFHKHDDHGHEKPAAEDLSLSREELLARENKKIKGAIRTDFVLSAEIMAISLGAVAASPFISQAITLSIIGFGMTGVIYGAVAGIVKADDIGLHLSRKKGDGLWNKTQRAMGNSLLWGAPKFMKALSFAGTAAMFMVGGGILAHGIPGAENVIHNLTHTASHAIPHSVPYAGAVIESVLPTLMQLGGGFIAGSIAIAGVNGTSAVYNYARSLLPGRGEAPEDTEPSAAKKNEPGPEPGMNPAPDHTLDNTVSLANRQTNATKAMAQAANPGQAANDEDHPAPEEATPERRAGDPHP